MPKIKLPVFDNSDIINIKDHIGLVVQQAKRYGAIHPIIDSDQYSVGMFGLFKASIHYDRTKINPRSGKPYAFSTYAIGWIKGMISRMNCKDDTLRHAGEKHQVMFSDLCFDGIHLVMPDITHSREIDPILEASGNEMVSTILNIVNKRYAAIITRYILENATLKTVAAEFGTCEERIRQILNSAYVEIRNVLKFKEMRENFQVHGPIKWKQQQNETSTIYSAKSVKQMKRKLLKLQRSQQGPKTFKLP